MRLSLTERLVTFIDQTKERLDCAIYDLRYPDVLVALKRLTASGRALRLLYDAGPAQKGGATVDPKPAGTTEAIAAAGLAAYAIPFTEHGHLMHNKFLVRDGAAFWTGSPNFTVGGLELQDNNCLDVISADLAARYTAAFEDLLARAAGGSSPAPPAAGGAVVVGDEAIAVDFSPSAGEAVEDRIVAALAAASEVKILAFLISDPGILQALKRFSAPQMQISGVVDRNGMADARRSKQIDPTLFWFMSDPRFALAPSHAFNPAGEQDFIHNKLMIFDDDVVVTGSYNFSENAELNSENQLQVTSKAYAGAATGYFDALYAKYPKAAAPAQL
jgi:phosphatidylserine/phosphatidylglycerophosphate/cardiolipin synthase-like enzyme